MLVSVLSAGVMNVCNKWKIYLRPHLSPKSRELFPYSLQSQLQPYQSMVSDQVLSCHKI